MKKLTTLILFICVFFLFISRAGDDCPKGNVISKLHSDMESFKAVLPLDFSRIISAGALANKAGTKVQVNLANAEFTIAQMSSDFVVPIKRKDQFIAVIKFNNGNDKIVPGTYNAASGYGKPFWAYAEVKLFKADKGVIVSLGVQEGSATISKLSDGNICGTFDLRTKAGTRTKGFIRGEFNCKLEISRW